MADRGPNRTLAGMVLDPIEPMRAASGPLPTGDDWAFEVKWDGMRLLAHTDGDRLILRTANLLDATDRFPELAGLPAAIGGRPAVLDGEVVCLDDEGHPSFSRLQRRIHVTDPAAARRAADADPTIFVVFDLLYFDTTPTTALPLDTRRDALVQVLAPGDAWTTTDLHDDGAALLAATADRGLEGVVAKRRSSTYQPGRRSPSWRKVKLRTHQELLVGGWTAGEGSRRGGLGALVLGYVDGDRGALRAAGRVGTGWDHDEARRLRALLDDRARDDDPFTPALSGSARRGVHFVEPTLVVEIAHGGWTDQGQIRHASYLGRRLDADPGSVGRRG